MNKADIISEGIPSTPQCRFFVQRKKRLCRMTVKPGRNYCGEHEPEPKAEDGKARDDTRIPCPYDPKHTCYASKLEKHLAICNARKQEQPDYIVYNINIPQYEDDFKRLPLSQTLATKILQVIEKVNSLYDKYLKDAIITLPEEPIHKAVLDEFNEPGRTESSLRHLRQASQLLHVVEQQELVKPNTCHLSYYAWWAWCKNTDSHVLLVDRASLRHKRDNKLRDSRYTKSTEDLNSDNQNNSHRIRADLAHLWLDRVPAVQACNRVVGVAKHLCGVATDYALRCITSEVGNHRVMGIVLATCCHHRCERPMYIANKYLQNMGITAEEFNVILGIVSWATCGDGRSRQRRSQEPETEQDSNTSDVNEKEAANITLPGDLGTKNIKISQEQREIIGRKAKVLLDYGRVLYLKECGFDARLVHYVPTSVSLENVCIIAKKIS
ncbi:putative coiled-coil domain-containing protein 76 [Danaus plexippus plexippus]|uniref:tRNA:m(4)X modification enzyme TRM13 n=1 Tax=Danaus plexippus plexippus TaxID=278856 RepID=A0A212EU66_DANPL|nr:putative coiled-coil domain-containing protein 76 [Danaus plexippus plexippus]